MQAGTPHSAKVNRDIAVNFAGRFATLGANYLFIPFYVRILGLDNYALIALYFVILTFAALADAGLSATITREAAREADRLAFCRKLVTAERMLLGAFATLGGTLALTAPWIASDWLSIANPGQRDEATDALRLMGGMMVFQQVMGLYVGALMGLQRQVTANTIQVAYILVRSGLVIPLIVWIPDIRLFFLWQLGANVAFMLLARVILMRAIGQTGLSPGRSDFALLRPSLGFAGGMMAMSLVAAINTQMDRVVTSALLPVSDFASFSLAASAAQLPYIVLVPFTAAILPRLTEAFERGQPHAALSVFVPVAFVSTAFAALASAGLVFFAPELLALWLGSEQVSPAMIVTVQIMAIGSLALAMGAHPHYIAIANGHTRTSLLLSMAVIPVSLIILLLAVPRYGIIAAAIPSVLSSLVVLLGQSLITHRRFLPQMSGAQFRLITVLPVAIGFTVVAGARMVADLTGTVGPGAIAVACVAGGAGLWLVWRIRFLINETFKDVENDAA